MDSTNYLAELAESQSEKPEERFTVKRTSRIEIIESKEKEKQTGKQTSVGLAIIKWIATIVIFLLTVISLVSSKVTLISIGQFMRPANFTGKTVKCNGKECTSDIAFAMIVWILLIPNMFSFFRTFGSSAFSNSALWPSKKSMLCGIASSFLEVIGLSAFAFILIGTTQNFGRTVLYMNGIFLLPIIFTLITECGKMTKGVDVNDSDVLYEPFEHEKRVVEKLKARRHHRWTSFFFFLAGLLALGGIGYIMYLSDNLDRITIAVFMPCLSMAWSTWMLKKQANPIKYFNDGDVMESPVDNIRVKSSRSRITMICSLLKICLIFIVSFALCRLFHIANEENPFIAFKRGTHEIWSTEILYNMFIVQIITSFLGYLMCWLSCTINLQKVCFVVPLVLSTPLSVVVSITKVCEFFQLEPCHNNRGEDYETFALGAMLWFSQVLSYSFQFFKSQQFLMAAEECLFWLPTYDGCLLEQHLLLNRKNEVTDEHFVNYHEIVKNSVIYICTTMYHEADYEMEQLLQSLAKVDMARKQSGRQFEAHVFFDDGARGEVVKMYALQLLSLIKDAMGIDPGKAFKLETPYGLQLKWCLPNGMPFVLHLKDKVKVKAKKRWSQVMYMSYVLDFKQERSRDDLTYILATDADVKFTPNDVMALMDLMSRNPKVGAVCGRTHPMGSGPMVWYQMFDYAIGHWLLKVANHVMGSVLCSPGCFSVYRARAIRDVLPLYATGVDCAMDFLIKDMGEDRWFCTLLVEAGWKLEYCATSEDSTYCPETFDEFFKQRRRWGPSTFANSIIVINKQESIRKNNDAISLFFIVYQMILMLSSIIGPSTVLMVIAGGLAYAFPNSVNLIVVIILLVTITFIFTMICLFCGQDTQLKWAKFLTFVFAIIMSMAFVGTILQTVDDVNEYISPPTKAPPTTYPPWVNKTMTTTSPQYIKNPIVFSPPTWYLFSLIGIFILTALLHGAEGRHLIHGIWYLLCLPSGYLLLTIYSVANLTDRSWGTREGKTATVQSDTTWYGTVARYFKYFCWCCVPPYLREKPPTRMDADEKTEVVAETKTEDAKENNESNEASSEDGDESNAQTGQLVDIEGDGEHDDSDGEAKDDDGEATSRGLLKPKKSALKKSTVKRYPSVEQLNERERLNSRVRSESFRFPGEKTVKFSKLMPKLHAATPVEEWLPNEYKHYAANFKKEGYDTVAFIAGNIKEKDLINIGIENRGHRKRLMFFIESLPPEEMFQEVPENVEDWLMNLGLEEYWPRFYENSYTEPRDLADIKYMNTENISSLFGITKEAHLKKLKMATSVLQYPTRAQTRIREARKAIMSEPVRQLKTDNADGGDEYKFWSELREICLLPEQAAFNQSGELVEKLGDLRDTCLLILTVANVLWLVFMVTVMDQKNLSLFHQSSFASVAFLFVYGVVLLFQFFSLLWHRLETLVHFIARAPFTPGHLKSNWAWRDVDLPPAPEPELLEEIRRRRSKLQRHDSNSSDTQREPLLGGRRSHQISFS